MTRWECFEDRSYFDMWAVRKTTSTEFGDCFHVPSRQEAEGLVETLNASEVRVFVAEDTVRALHRAVQSIRCALADEEDISS